MGGKNGQKKGIGPLPTLFVGIGPCAEKTLAEFSRVVRRVTVPLEGPFGLALMDSSGKDLFQCDWPCASDFRIPEPAVFRERSEFVGHDDGKLLTAVSSLLRRLRSVCPAADRGGAGRLRMNCSLLLDLSEPAVVPSAGRLMQALRKAEPALDVTVLGLTARTAATDSTRDSLWFEAWKQLLAELQDEPFAQRVYLLDGCDADKTWFEKPEQLHHLGAEFLLHHGLICRETLRQGERARIAMGEGLLNVCGSFGCRTIQADLSVVAERIAEKVAVEDLAELYKHPVRDGWLESVQEQAQSLANAIASIDEKVSRTRTPVPGEWRDRAGAGPHGTMDLDQAMARAIRHVCSREPLVSLCHFFRCLQPKLRILLTRRRLWERAATRLLVAEVLRRQDETTYTPMRNWLAQPWTRWADRFTPERGEVSHVAVSRPAALGGYLAGMALMVMGLIGIAAGLSAAQRLLLVAGGLLSLAATVLMTLPTGWVRHPRNRVREGQETSASIPVTRYRKRASRQTRRLTAGLVLLGLAGVLLPWWPDPWTPAAALVSLVAVVTAGVGLILAVAYPAQRHPEQAAEREAPDHAGPPVWRYRVIGMSALAIAWIVFCLGMPIPRASDMTVPWAAHLVGLALVIAGLAWALSPRTGRTRFIDHVPKMPQPLGGGIGRPAAEDELGRRLVALADWIERLSLDPDLPLGRARTASVPPGREVLFDFLAADWEDQLARAFRLALESRSGKSLGALALQPVLWTECITKELQDPRTAHPDLTCLFALQAVKAWIGSHSLTDLLSLLQVDMDRFHRLAARLASPHWPTPRAEPAVSTGVIAVAKPLWDVLAPLVGGSEGPAIVPLDWDASGDAIVVARIVQGLAEGWRGYPGMPGQPQDGALRSSPREAAG